MTLPNWLRAAALTVTLAASHAAETNHFEAGKSTVTEAHRSHAEAAYQAARTAATQSNSINHLWELGRAAFDYADTVTREKTKAQIAETGIAACRTAIGLDPASAPAHYYLALCLGELAQTKTLGALRLVREIKDEFDRVRVLDNTLDHAGADRGLGLLYLEAPGWPTSIGDRKLARSHLENAVALAPNYPDNRLSLAELYLRTKDTRASATELVALTQLWPLAKSQFAGPEWTQAWLDWDNRLHLLEARLQKLTGKK